MAVTTDDASAAIVCRGCRRALARSDFHKSNLRPSKYQCRSCVKVNNARYFLSHRETHLCAEIRRREREQFGAHSEDTKKITVKMYKQALSDYCNRCFVSGDGRTILTLMRVDAGKPLDLTNCVPVGRRAGRLLNYSLPSHLVPEYRKRVSRDQEPPSPPVSHQPPSESTPDTSTATEEVASQCNDECQEPSWISRLKAARPKSGLVKKGFSFPSNKLC